ncbi:MAG: RusA family crossover junction endodeoxyribonuclease [Selenomonadaceae bacterium]|nr:RusA family crossover junction endodeoxyribonuclease [Selenomonadaceae bacterium]
MNTTGMSTIKFSVPTLPVPFMRTGFQEKRRYNYARYTNYKNLVGLVARRAMNGRAPLTGAIKVVAEFFKHKPQPRKGSKPQVTFQGDVDNFLKAVLDAMNGICYEDDRQVIFVQATKIFGEPHITVEVEEITQ